MFPIQMATEVITDEREKAYPIPQLFRSMLPAYGFCVRHVDGLRFENVKFECGWQEPMDMKAFRNVEFANCSFSSGSGEKEPPAVNECKGGWEILP